MASATNWTSQISLSSTRLELRWSNFPLVNLPIDVEKPIARDSDESIKTGWPTRFIAETVEDEIDLPGYAQVRSRGIDHRSQMTFCCLDMHR
jgi:hypothetical protein